MLKKLAAAGDGNINLQELGITNMQELLEDMEENDKIMEDLEKPWEQKLAESKEQSNAPADSSIADQDTMEESKDMGSAASNSRVETSQDAETSGDIFNQTSPS